MSINKIELKATFLTWIFLIPFTFCSPPESLPIRNFGLVAEHAMVVSAHRIASESGKRVLQEGGNAFDAAVAVHFALAVVYPQAGNIGGGGFAVFRKNDGTTGTLDFREKAPLSASRDMYLDESGEIVKDKSMIGHMASGVPGSVDGIFKLHEKHGILPFGTLVQPAIDLAQNGHAINESLAKELNEYRDIFLKVNQREIPYTKIAGWQKGDTLINIDLANTLKEIRDHGRAGFYEGIVANHLVTECMKANGSITLEDLSRYESKWRSPLIGTFQGHKIITMPPPSAGGVTLLQMLHGTELLELEKFSHNSASSIHRMVEIERRAYADRATYLGDPDFVEIPVDRLLSDHYNRNKFSSINPDQATPSSLIKEGNVEIIESMETTHFSILDQQGNAVSITTTLNSYFGSKTLVEGAGFFLNNEMDDFSAKPGAPNQFGLVGTEANAIAPEKRMLSSMTPTIVEKDGKVKMVLGTPGGSTIITSVYQAIVNVILHEMTMQEAVDAPKFHSQWQPDKVYFEINKFKPRVLDSLIIMGHKVEYRDLIGKLECILVADDKSIEGAPDHTRNESAAAGF